MGSDKGATSGPQSELLSQIAGIGQNKADSTAPIQENLGNIFNEMLGGTNPSNGNKEQAEVDAKIEQAIRDINSKNIPDDLKRKAIDQLNAQRPVLDAKVRTDEERGIAPAGAAEKFFGSLGGGENGGGFGTPSGIKSDVKVPTFDPFSGDIGGFAQALQGGGSQQGAATQQGADQLGGALQALAGGGGGGLGSSIDPALIQQLAQNTESPIDIIPAAGGFSGTTTKPTAFLASEFGQPENVNIQPQMKPGEFGGNGNITNPDGTLGGNTTDTIPDLNNIQLPNGGGPGGGGPPPPPPGGGGPPPGGSPNVPGLPSINDIVGEIPGQFSFDGATGSNPLIGRLQNQLASGVNESSAARGAFGGSANQSQILDALAPLALGIDNQAFGQQAGQFNMNSGRANQLAGFQGQGFNQAGQIHDRNAAGLTQQANLDNVAQQNALLPINSALSFLGLGSGGNELSNALSGLNQSTAQNQASNPKNQLAGAAGGLGGQALSGKLGGGGGSSGISAGTAQ